MKKLGAYESFWACHYSASAGNNPNWRIAPIPNATCDDKAFVALALQHLQESYDMGSLFEGSKSDEIHIENTS